MQILHEKTATGTIDKVGARLEQAAQNHKFGVLNVVDLKAKMNSKGVDFRIRDARRYAARLTRLPNTEH